MSFSEIRDSDRLLVILRVLEEQGYTLNESLIQNYLELIGHNVSRDRVRTDLEWLKEQGLITIETVVSVYVATITVRGIDVAKGRTTVPGVKRPGPRG